MEKSQEVLRQSSLEKKKRDVVDLFPSVTPVAGASVVNGISIIAFGP